MADPLPSETRVRLQTLAAEGRRDIERHLFPQYANTGRMVILRAIGAVGLGIFAAGLAVFLIVVVLNLVFHYGPA
jgi:hypothetical protein